LALERQVVLVGDVSVGKTHILSRYMKDRQGGSMERMGYQTCQNLLRFLMFLPEKLMIFG